MKKIFKYILLILSLILLVSCGKEESIQKKENKKSNNSQTKQEEKNTEQVKKIENKEELLKAIEKDEKRIEEKVKENRLSEKTEEDEEGVSIGASLGVSTIPYGNELLEYEPKFTEEESENALKIQDKYLDKKGLKDVKKGITANPMVNKIYIDENKGKMKDYDNDNIFITEYLDDKEYKYIFLGRNSKNDEWKVVYDGESYK